MRTRATKAFRPGLAAGLVVAVVAAWPWTAARAYSLLPLATEEARTLPSGEAEAILGAAFTSDLRFPAFTPPGALQGQTLVAAPQIGFRMGAGGWAEFQASFEMLYLDETDSGGGGHRAFGAGDARIATKLRLWREGSVAPALALHLLTKLPNANRSQHLGTDDTDFAAQVLAAKRFGRLQALANVGLLLLGNSGPTTGNSYQGGGQDDLVIYSAAGTFDLSEGSAPGAANLRLLAEVAGQGASHFDNDRCAARLGAQFARGQATFYLGVSAGLITASENVGASGGVVYRFEPARLFGLGGAEETN